jgi:hypothetical protein
MSRVDGYSLMNDPKKKKKRDERETSERKTEGQSLSPPLPISARQHPPRRRILLILIARIRPKIPFPFPISLTLLLPTRIAVLTIIILVISIVRNAVRTLHSATAFRWDRRRWRRQPPTALPRCVFVFVYRGRRGRVRRLKRHPHRFATCWTRGATATAIRRDRRRAHVRLVLPRNG